jgi:isocitrate dehydrogenase (NAD+)
MTKVTLIRGDGTGPEVVDAAVKVIAATGVDIEWDEQPAGEAALRGFGDTLPRRTVQSILRNRLCLKGPVTTPVGEGFRSVNVELRKTLGLYAGVRPAKSLAGAAPFEKVNLVVIRENTEDVYAGVEFEPGSAEALDIIKKSHGGVAKDSAISIKSISPGASKRIARFALDYARKNNRKKITVVHKANIMKATDGLWLRECRAALSRAGPKIAVEDRIVDNMAMQLVTKPREYDLLLCSNLYGDILSDLCAGLVGGLGLMPGANYGEDAVVFEPAHGSAPKHAGKNKVNPTAMILCGALLLRELKFEAEARKIENAVARVVAEGRAVTYDLARKGRPVGTREMAEAIARRAGGKKSH